jgi:hypothetical protein
MGSREHDLVTKAFGNDITSKVMPRGARLHEFANTLGTGRTVAQIRSYIHNFISGKLRFEGILVRYSRGSVAWSSTVADIITTFSETFCVKCNHSEL